MPRTGGIDNGHRNSEYPLKSESAYADYKLLHSWTRKEKDALLLQFIKEEKQRGNKRVKQENCHVSYQVNLLNNNIRVLKAL
jgi:hypothetical protein